MQPSLPTPHVPAPAPFSPPVEKKEPVAEPLPPAFPALHNPVAASDEDVIEKEWVQRLKHIIATTKHDPFLQEHEISKLQADYLLKRYGKQVKVPADD